MSLHIDVLPIECPLCGEQMPKLSRDHAISHGYASLTAFRKDNDINYLTLSQRSKEDLKRLYNVNFKRWVVGYKAPDGMRYVTKKYDPFADKDTPSASKFPIGDGSFYAHFKGSNPLAIFAYGTHSRFFCFDVDTHDKAEDDTFTIIEQLRGLGISDEHIHVSFSGSKGYHVELFTDKHFRHEDWQLFADYVRYLTGFTDKEVEGRPTATNGHALKLPLTFHPKTQRFAGYCDSATLEMYDIIESHDYLHTIEQMNSGIIFDILRKARASAAEIRKEEQRRQKEQQHEKEQQGKRAVQVRNVDLFQTTEQKEEKAKRLLTQGLPGKGERWKAMRDTLVPYLKIKLGNSPEDTTEILKEWTKREIDRGNVATGYDECIGEVVEMIETWYPIVHDFYTVVRDIEVTRSEIDWVMSVIENGGTRNARDLLWVLLLLSKAYEERYKRVGSFFASRELVQKLLSKPKMISPSTIAKQRRWLVENGYIEFEVPEHSYKKRLATTYKLSYIEEVKPEIIDSLFFTEDADGRKLLFNIAERLYTPTALKKLKVI